MIVSLMVITSNEQPYINHFINHYSLLGFDKIYLIMDRGYNDLVIDDDLREKIEIQFLKIIYKNDKDDFTIAQIDTYNFYKDFIFDDWLFICDTDEYLYLHDGNIKNYLTNIPNNIDQIQFPWLITENIGETNLDLYQQLDINKYYKNNHVKSIVRPQKIKQIYSHTCIIDNDTIINNKIINNPQQSYDIDFDYNTYKNFPFVIHFHSRGIDNIFIKILEHDLKDKSDSDQKNKLINYINNRAYNKLISITKFSLLITHTKGRKLPEFSFNFHENKYKIDIEQQNRYLLYLLDKFKIDVNNYNYLKNNVHLIFNLPINFSCKDNIDDNLSFFDIINHNI